MKFLPFLVILFVLVQGLAQDPLRFRGEVEVIQRKYDSLWDGTNSTIVFTGSSSIRIWQDLKDRFKDHQIVNTGFGGSQASDLLHYCNELILRYHPKTVFIYEGDNDISAGKKPNRIFETTKAIMDQIWKKDSSTRIVLISAKPSLVRWNMRRRYKRLNRKFKKLSEKKQLLDYADVWRPMLEKRKVKKDIFIADGLHMNSKGYEIWYEVLKPLIY